MRLNRFLLLPSLFTFLFLPAMAQVPDTAGDEYEVKARVIRISLLHGEASLKRHETDEWENARVNTPLVEGDTVSTGRDGRLEIQIDARNFLRLSSDSVLSIVTLRDEGIALSLAEGTGTLRLARFDRDKEYFEIDAPKTTVAAESQGLYRITAGSDSRVLLTVREGGQARVYSDTAGFTVRDGRTAMLTFTGDDSSDWQTVNALARDAWDDWVTDREKYLAARLKYDQNMRYYDSDIWGAEDLDSYGTWAYANDYGWTWRPSITVINNYSDWSPYRYGRWSWLPPYGWTWIGDEPWGWAPYHYGRWVYTNNYWAWCPHSYYRSQRNWWRPALVAFVSIDSNYGSSYGWYPLSYRHRDPRSTYFHRDRDRLHPLRGDELASLRHLNPAYLRALNTMPAPDFGRGRGQPANGDMARRVLDARTLQGDLPIRPNPVAGNRGDNRVARPASAIAQRPTGATTRLPGVTLDNELRRSRIFNGREPAGGSGWNGGRPADARPTGAVTRPSRPVGLPVNPNSDLRRNPNGSGSGPGRVDPPVGSRPRNESPADRKEIDHNPPVRVEDERPRSPGSGGGPIRPIRPSEDRPVDRREVDHNPPAREENERPPSPGSGGDPVRPRPRGDRPVDRREVDHNPPAREEGERPARRDSPPQSERVERPSRDYSPANPARNDSPERPAAPPRSESPRQQPPPRNDPPPRSEPQQRSVQPPRSEPPQRHESPPQRAEPAPRPERPGRPSQDEPPQG